MENQTSLVVPSTITVSLHDNQTSFPAYQVRSMVDLKSPILLVYLTIFAISSFGNGLVIYIIGRFHEVRIQSVANYYIWNLAYADLFLSLTLPFVCYASFTNDWPFGDIVCKSSHAVRDGNKFVGVYTLVALSVDRYVASYYQLGRLRTITIGKCVCAVIWVCSALLTIPYWTYGRSVSVGHGRNSCRMLWPPLQGNDMMKFWLYFQFIVGFLCPFFTIFAAYIGLGFRLRRLLGSNRRSSVKRPGRAMTRMTLVSAIAFLLTQLPYYVMEMANRSKRDQMLSRKMRMSETSEFEMKVFIILTATAKILVYVSSCCNPVIYGLLNKNYRKLYTDALTCSLFCHRRQHLHLRRQQQLRQQHRRIRIESQTRDISTTVIGRCSVSLQIAYGISCPVLASALATEASRLDRKRRTKRALSKDLEMSKIIIEDDNEN